LNHNKRLIREGTLFDEITKILDIEPSNTIGDNFEMDNSIQLSFPKLRGYDGDILNDTLFILRIPSKDAKFGYSINTLLLETIENNQKLYFACIPPLNERCIQWINDGEFKIISISLLNIIKSEGKIDSVSLECDAFVNGIKLVYSRTYDGNKLRYINKFPVIQLYGIAPKYGYIARRDIEFLDTHGSPLKNENKIEIGKVKDIELDGLEFESISEEYDYSLCSGYIPEWVGIIISGDWCGALPLRAMSGRKEGEGRKEYWKKLPAFAHQEFPEDKKLHVAVDLGSSRTIVLFKNENRNSVSSILIEKDQLLTIPITSPLDSDTDEFAFERFLFRQRLYLPKTSNTPPFNLP